MDDDREKVFLEFVRERYPEDKRGTSGVYHQSLGAKILQALKDPSSTDKNFRFWIKKKGFRLLNVPSLGVREVLVMPVKEKEVKLLCM